jgi:hypothetical protein
MESDSLKSAWKRIPTGDRSNQELKMIIRERGRSLTGKIRRQLIIEIVFISSFLIVYYDFFDGDQKPLYANISLVAALFLFVVHNILGIAQMIFRNKGESIDQVLRSRVLKMKIYAAVASALRFMAGASFLLFFISVIKFTQVKYWILFCIVIVFLIQMIFFIKMWLGRIRRMKEIVDSLGSNG